MPDNDPNVTPNHDRTGMPVKEPIGVPHQHQTDVQGKYLSDVQLAARYGVHRSTPWRWIKADKSFPKPFKLSPQCSRWKLSEIEAWEAAKAAKMT